MPCLGGPFGRLEIGIGKGFQIVVQLSFVSLVSIGVVHKLISPSSPPPLSNAASQDRKNSRIYIVAARLGAARLRSDGRNDYRNKEFNSCLLWLALNSFSCFPSLPFSILLFI